MYKSIFSLVEAHGIKSISIPVIGVGINRFPLVIVAKIALEEAKNSREKIDIRFACFASDQRSSYQNESARFSS